MMPFKKWLGEIHRRSLWQALGMYLAGAWIALQVVDVLANSLDLPRWIPVGVILLILAGLPVTLITAFLQAERVAAESADAPEADDVPSSAAPPPDPNAAEGWVPRGLFTWRNAIGGGIVAFAVWGVVAAGWIILIGRGEGMEPSGETELDRGVVAVLPFRVSGARNLDFLAEGMVDLLGAKLSGEGGIRAADPRAVMSAWTRSTSGVGSDLRRDTAARLARSIGAGQVLLGGIVGTPARMIVNASILDVQEGTLEARASVEGSLDSLTAIVDRLAVELLAGEADEDDQRLGALTSTSLQALMAYLDGQAAYRRGDYSDANRSFRRALEADSTFALAALAWVSSAWWSPGYTLFNEVRAKAWDLRDRLSSRDRALLDAWTGPRYPLTSGWAEHLVRWDLAIAAAPERPESWYESGDIFFHYGPLLGVPDWQERAGARFRRAAELDPTFAAPLGHLLELSALTGDSDEIRAHLEAYASVDSIGETSSFLAWRAASALGDEGRLEEIRGTFPDLDGSSLNRIMGMAQLYDSSLATAELAGSILARRVGTITERWEWLLGLHSLALNRGRPQEALAVIREWIDVEGSPGESLRISVLDGLYWDGDPEASARAAETLMSSLDSLPASEGNPSETELANLCVVEQWRLWRGDTRTASASLARFRALADEQRFDALPLRHAVCAAAIEALLAMAQERPEAEEAVQRLDGLLHLVPDVATGDDPSLVSPFIVARWKERQGDVNGALAVMRRWHNHWFTGVRYLSTYLRDQGRLAALAGEWDEADRAFRHYLMLRADAEPALREERDSIRARLADLPTAGTEG